MNNTDPLRDVVTYEFSQSSYCRPGHGRWKVTLKCGHIMWPKRSTKVGKRARCYFCGSDR